MLRKKKKKKKKAKANGAVRESQRGREVRGAIDNRASIRVRVTPRVSVSNVKCLIKEYYVILLPYLT